MALQIERAAAARFLHYTVGFWLGVYAFRSYVPTAVWNLSDALPLALKGALAIGIHLAGVAGVVLPVTRRKHALPTLAAVAAATGLLRQIFIADDTIGSALSLASWIAWLWWLAAAARQLQQKDAPMIAAAFAAALSLQVGMQAAWHGLDLPMVRGPVAIACAVVINALFALSARTAQIPPVGSTVVGARIFIAIGIALFLELTLLANVGRIGQITGLGLTASALVIQAGLVVGVLVSSLAGRKSVQLAGIVMLLFVAGAAPYIAGAGAAVLIVGQAATIMLITAGGAHASASSARAFVLGTVALFAFVFLFYNWYELPVLWLIAAIALAACVLPIRTSQSLTPAFGLAPACGLVLLPISLAAPNTSVENAARPALRVLTYNIHQGYDAYGTPAMQNIADEIAAENADVIALQEVGRGWTFVGGADLIAYLRYRFPAYNVHFVPVNGQLWGVALLSRVPLDSLSGTAFAAPPHTFRYGYAAGILRSNGNTTRLVSVHLTAGLEGNGEDGRIDQVDQLLRMTADHQQVIIAGDLNTHPDEPPMQRLAAAGFTDAGVRAGIGKVHTWPAHRPNERIDYVLTRGVEGGVSGSVKSTNASDHLPVLIEIAARTVAKP